MNLLHYGEKGYDWHIQSIAAPVLMGKMQTVLPLSPSVIQMSKFDSINICIGMKSMAGASSRQLPSIWTQK